MWTMLTITIWGQSAIIATTMTTNSMTRTFCLCILTLNDPETSKHIFYTPLESVVVWKKVTKILFDEPRKTSLRRPDWIPDPELLCQNYYVRRRVHFSDNFLWRPLRWLSVWNGVLRPDKSFLSYRFLWIDSAADGVTKWNTISVFYSAWNSQYNFCWNWKPEQLASPEVLVTASCWDLKQKDKKKNWISKNYRYNNIYTGFLIIKNTSMQHNYTSKFSNFIYNRSSNNLDNVTYFWWPEKSAQRTLT